LGPIPNPQSPIPNPQSPYIISKIIYFYFLLIITKLNLLLFQILLKIIISK